MINNIFIIFFFIILIIIFHYLNKNISQIYYKVNKVTDQYIENFINDSRNNQYND
jgi:hypothetical protein